VEEAALPALQAEYSENNDRIDAGMHIQTYLQLMLTAQYAFRAECALWVMK